MTDFRKYFVNALLKYNANIASNRDRKIIASRETYFSKKSENLKIILRPTH